MDDFRLRKRHKRQEENVGFCWKRPERQLPLARPLACLLWEDCEQGLDSSCFHNAPISTTNSHSPGKHPSNGKRYVVCVWHLLTTPANHFHRPGISITRGHGKTYVRFLASARLGSMLLSVTTWQIPMEVLMMFAMDQNRLNHIVTIPD
jgi:hypothetical protein